MSSKASSDRAPTAIASLGKLSKEARGLLRESMPAEDYLTVLDKDGRHRDAVIFLAYWLESRHAVWWGCQCLWLDCRDHLEPAAAAGMQTIVRWVLNPGEPACRQCQAVAAELTGSQPIGLLAQAAFATGNSLAPPGQPEVPPPPTLTAASVSAALQLAAQRGDPGRGLQQFALLGLDVARGKNLWS